MARLQVLELPLEERDGSDDGVRAPFALILDQLSGQEAHALRRMPDDLEAFATKCGARAIGIFESTIDLS